ncbi:MAG: V-type ATPase subunit, partial [Vulcanimicrobiota bacterium]
MYELNFPVLGKPSKYGFANAVLAILENGLISQNLIDQLKVADSEKELFRMLSETGYGHYLDKNMNIDQIVENETIKTKEELFEILPEEDHWFFEIFFKKYDYNNLKILLKTRFLGVEPSSDEL